MAPSNAAGSTVKKKSASVARDIWISTGAKSDWPYFARWHYRSHHVGLTRFVTLLWHGDEPIGICVFTSPPLSLSLRNVFFRLSGKWSRVKFQALNAQLVTLSRVVIHPSYRGAGLAAAFVRASCRACPWPWIEALAQMGRYNAFFERAGFVRVGSKAAGSTSREAHSALYGTRRRRGKKRLVTPETHRKSQYAEPVYYVFDNRPPHSREGGPGV